MLAKACTMEWLYCGEQDDVLATIRGERDEVLQRVASAASSLSCCDCVVAHGGHVYVHGFCDWVHAGAVFAVARARGEGSVWWLRGQRTYGSATAAAQLIFAVAAKFGTTTPPIARMQKATRCPACAANEDRGNTEDGVQATVFHDDDGDDDDGDDDDGDDDDGDDDDGDDGARATAWAPFGPAEVSLLTCLHDAAAVAVGARALARACCCAEMGRRYTDHVGTVQSLIRSHARNDSPVARDIVRCLTHALQQMRPCA